MSAVWLIALPEEPSALSIPPTLRLVSSLRAFSSRGVKTKHGGKWELTKIRNILSNEKYAGDALLQKSYTKDFLTKKRVKNNGEIPQYYVEDSHPAIVSKEVFALAASRLRKSYP